MSTTTANPPTRTHAPLVTATGDPGHPGTRVKRVHLDAVARIQTRATRHGRPWTDELDVVLHAGLLALGEAGLLPDPDPS